MALTIEEYVIKRTVSACLSELGELFEEKPPKLIEVERILRELESEFNAKAKTP